MIEETAAHSGHLEIARELLDGKTRRQAAAAVLSAAHQPTVRRPIITSGDESPLPCRNSLAS